MARAVVVAAGIVAAALLGVGEGAAVQAQTPKLMGIVGPGPSITLRTVTGARVTRLDPGTYEIEVQDLADDHNFRLRGPGVNRATGVDGNGTETWTVTLAVGTYTYLCDPHSGSMRGTFTVGNPVAPVKTVTPKTRLVLASGPGRSITLKTAGGFSVKQMKVGTYDVTVRDRSRAHNARLRGPGYNRATTPLTYVGTQKWKVALKRPGTLTFLCDPHAARGMRGTAKIVR